MPSERKIRHEYFGFPEELLPSREGTWFHKYGLSSTGVIFAHPDIFFSRGIIASMLCEAWNRDEFFDENSRMMPEPTEIDRMLQIAWLQQVASNTGLINGEEIRRIQALDGRVPLGVFMQGKDNTYAFEELAALTARWHANGETVGLFHGSFDPPTVTHLSCALEAYEHCDHLLIGFDNDSLLRKRKGESRPRFPIAERRRMFGNFWMVDGTVELRATDVADEGQYAADYSQLNVDYVFLARGQEDLDKRLRKIAMGGAEPVYLNVREGQFSSTRLMDNAREWGFIK